MKFYLVKSFSIGRSGFILLYRCRCHGIVQNSSKRAGNRAIIVAVNTSSCLIGVDSSSMNFICTSTSKCDPVNIRIEWVGCVGVLGGKGEGERQLLLEKEMSTVSTKAEVAITRRKEAATIRKDREASVKEREGHLQLVPLGIS